MTSLAEERAEQERWNARLREPVAKIYNSLLENEFELPDKLRVRIGNALRKVLDVAAREVPHYRDALRRARADPRDGDPMDVLAALPVLTKLDVQDAGRALLAEHLPPGEETLGWSQSSGTTARPMRVLHTKRSMWMYGLLAQRASRWHRFDPAGKVAEMRIPSLLPSHPDGRMPASGETMRLDTWRSLEHFATGPYVATSVIAPVEQLLDWLRLERPDYFMTYSETLEVIARAAGDERPVDSLKGVSAISEQLTPNMRSYVERRFATPVHQIYGLMEFGLAGIRCEAGRYHINREHCFAEIVDEKGRACSPGETGRVLLTTMTNFAMPLIRYDTGDLAEAAGGICSCNRTLPSFGDLVGRYSRIAFLPEGTMGLVTVLREAIENMPAALAHDLREFQIHQFADNRMELRYVARALLPDGFHERLRAEWAKGVDGKGPELAIRRVDEVPRSPGGKSEVFTSDFMPARNEKPAPAA